MDTMNTRTSGFDHSRYPLRVNLGCGFDVRDGYLNVDFAEGHDPDLVADVRHLDLLPSALYEEVLAQDILEHLPRADARPALLEWARLLRPGGLLRLRVPDLIGLLGLLGRRRALEEQHELVQCLYGTQAYPGDYHLNGFTEVLLRHMLHDAGFTDVVLSHRDEWLFEVTAVRSSDPGPLALGDLPFMDLPAARTQGLEGLDLLIDKVAARSVIDAPPAPTTRLRLLKRLGLRLARLVTTPQVAHNAAVLDVLREVRRLLAGR